MGRKLLYTLAILLGAALSWGDVVCVGTSASCSGAGGSGTVTGPGAACTDNALPRWDGATTSVLQCSDIIVTDAEAVTGITTLTGVDLIGTTSVSGGAASTAANSVWITANTINAEGSSADASETTLIFGNPTADTSWQFDGAASLATLTASTNAVISASGGTLSLSPFGNVNISPTSGLLAIPSDGAASSITINSTGSIIGEGSTVDANETTLTFGDATADFTLTFTGTAAGMSLTGGPVLIPNGTAAAPALGFTAAATTGIYHSTGLEFSAAGTYRVGVYSGGLHVGNGGQLWLGASTTDTNAGFIRTANGIIKVTDGSTGGGQLRIGAGDLTSATMTAGTIAETRTVTSSYTWSNAQVVALGAALTGDITVATLPAKTQMLDAAVVITGTGAGTTTLTVSCGDAIGGTPFINYVVASDAKAAANTVYGDAAAERGTSIDTEFYYLPSYTATTLVTCHFIATGANLDQVTGSTGRVILTTRLLP